MIVTRPMIVTAATIVTRPRDGNKQVLLKMPPGPVNR
jgi:hypothetical protein